MLRIQLFLPIDKSYLTRKSLGETYEILGEGKKIGKESQGSALAAEFR